VDGISPEVCQSSILLVHVYCIPNFANAGKQPKSFVSYGQEPLLVPLTVESAMDQV
jgi:hypothetical protein